MLPGELEHHTRVDWLAVSFLILALTGGGAPTLVTAQEPFRAETASPQLPRQPAASTPRPPDHDIGSPTPLTQKQKQDLLKSNFDKMKRDADELSTLAQSLQKDLEKSNENVLSVGVLEKAEKIEKLAKKIKSAATAY